MISMGNGHETINDLEDGEGKGMMGGLFREADHGEDGEWVSESIELGVQVNWRMVGEVDVGEGNVLYGEGEQIA